MNLAICNKASLRCISMQHPCKHSTFHLPMELSKNFYCVEDRGYCEQFNVKCHCQMVELETDNSATPTKDICKCGGSCKCS
jgi:hypothetical protein